MENQGDEETRFHGTARRRRLALFPLPFQGHLNPMLQLAGILHSRGFSVAIIHTRFNSPPKSNYPHFTFHPIADGLSESQVSTTAAFDLLRMLQDNCASGLRDCLGELLMSEEPVACLIVDSWWLSSKSVADSFGLPRMVLRTGSVTSFLGFSAMVLLQENGYLQDSQPEEAVPELPPLQIRDLPNFEPHESQGLYPLIVAMIEQFKTSSGIIWNSFEELEPPSMTKFRQDFPVPSFPVGPFHKYFPASSSSLLSQDQSCISLPPLQSPPAPSPSSVASLGVAFLLPSHRSQLLPTVIASPIGPHIGQIRYATAAASLLVQPPAIARPLSAASAPSPSLLLSLLPDPGQSDPTRPVSIRPGPTRPVLIHFSQIQIYHASPVSMWGLPSLT